jgi:tetratricopeptide (TPR) repeat protein
MKIGRNDPCPCNSGKKYKKCCLNLNNNGRRLEKLTDIDLEIEKAGRLSLEHDKECIEKSIIILSSILNDKKLTEDQFVNATLSLVTAKQHFGEHNNALKIIDTLRDRYDGKSDLSVYILIRIAISYISLGYTEKACEIYDEILSLWDDQKIKNDNDRKIRGIHLIEIGKAYSVNNNNIKAKNCWEKSLSYLKGIEREKEHFYRAKSNLAYLLLKSTDEKDQQLGVLQLEDLTQKKLLIGDIQGVSTNYCNLGTYFRRIGRYERAIAYYRKDLSLSKIVGDKREIASTLGNLATLYAELKQFTNGRRLLREAQQFGEQLEDEHLLHITKHQLEYLNNLAREAGINNVQVGDKAECLCGSGKLYTSCCGRADFEPVDIPYIYGGLSEDRKVIEQEIAKFGKKTSPLDFILRSTDQSRRRYSWCEIGGHDGWLSLKELPDMANIHLFAAKDMAEAAKGYPDSINYPLSAVILSVCYLEAFINQLSFFIHENRNHPELIGLALPQELCDKGIQLFQRTTQLEAKWLMITGCLLGEKWLSSQSVWNEVKNLIYIRNELVHFKTDGYEQVVPPPSKRNKIYEKIPIHVDAREVPHSWPMKLLTPSLAMWAVEISETITEALKMTYNLNRRKTMA